MSLYICMYKLKRKKKEKLYVYMLYYILTDPWSFIVFPQIDDFDRKKIHKSCMFLKLFFEKNNKIHWRLRIYKINFICKNAVFLLFKKYQFFFTPFIKKRKKLSWNALSITYISYTFLYQIVSIYVGFKTY